MRLKVFIGFLVAVGIATWLFAEREPAFISRDPAPEPSQIASTDVSPEPLRSVEPQVPGESTGDPELDAQLAERKQRLEQIRRDVERRSRVAAEESRSFEEEVRRRLTASGRGGSTSQTSEASLEDSSTLDAIAEEDPPEEDQPDPSSVESLEAEAAQRASEQGLVPESALDGLSVADRRKLLADAWVWHKFLVSKFGPDYTVSQANIAEAARSAFEKATLAEQLRRLEASLQS